MRRKQEMNNPRIHLKRARVSVKTGWAKQSSPPNAVRTKSRGSFSQLSCLASLKDSWGKTYVDTRRSKWSLRSAHVDLGFTLHNCEYSNHIHQATSSPFSQELEDQILTFAREPHLTRCVKIKLVQICFYDLGCKRGNEVFSKGHILLERTRQLAGAAKTMKEPVKSTIGPFFGLPPFRTFSLSLILWQSVRRNRKVNNGKEKATPRNNGLGRLLVV